PCNPARRDGSRYPKAVEDYRRPRRFALVGGAHSTSFVIDEEFCHAPSRELERVSCGVRNRFKKRPNTLLLFFLFTAGFGSILEA
ncbi:MAG: hypothetical protein K9N62_14510, partial [Verrucomicrobia bacterium]|nr:hypothetical protein [Verrucomicrobiota bacterium]